MIAVEAMKKEKELNEYSWDTGISYTKVNDTNVVVELACVNMQMLGKYM